MNECTSTLRTRSSLVAISAVMAAGCATRPIGVIDERSSAPSSTEAVVVHGFSQPDFRYVFVKGKVEDGMFEQTKSVGVLVDKPNHGYLVGKLEAGDVIALTMAVRTERHGSEPINVDLKCGEAVRVFAVPGGKVSYLGDAFISATQNRELRVSYSDNLQAAKSHIDSNFPALKDRLEQISPQVVRYKCRPTYQYYIIYK